MIVSAFVLPEIRCGMMEARITRGPIISSHLDQEYLEISTSAQSIGKDAARRPRPNDDIVEFQRLGRS